MSILSRVRRCAGRIGLSAVFVLSGVLFAPAEALAQGFRFGAQAGGAQTISEADLKTYEKVLGLDDAQSQAAEALHGAYVAERQRAERDLRDQFRKLRDEFEDSRDMSIWQTKMPDVTNAHTAKTKELDKGFLDDLKSLLRPDQASKWTSLERTHRRRQGMAAGMLAGESVDLITIIDGMQVQRTPELSDTLDRYSSELDSALQERSRQREDLSKQMQESGRNAGGGMPDFQALEKIGTDMRKAGLKVRDINDRYAVMLRSSIPSESQEEFDTQVRKAKFPTVYNEPHTLKSIDAAAKFDDLDNEQKTGIKEVRLSYERDLQGANERLAKAIAQSEAEGGGDSMFGGMARWMSREGRDEGESELVKARRARRELDRQALDKLHALLSESQIDRLPEREDFGGPGGGRRGGPGEGGGRRNRADGESGEERPSGDSGRRNSGRRPSGDR